jgi:hypothetical protein
VFGGRLPTVAKFAESEVARLLVVKLDDVWKSDANPPARLPPINAPTELFPRSK